MGNEGSSPKGAGFKKFATPRIIGGIAIAIIVLWALSIMFGSSDETPSKNGERASRQDAMTAAHSAGDDAEHGEAAIAHDAIDTESTHSPASASTADEHVATDDPTIAADHGSAGLHASATDHDSTERHASASDHAAASESDAASSHGTAATTGHDASTDHETDAHGTSAVPEKPTADHSTSHSTPQTAADHGATDQPHETAAGHPLPETVTAPLHKPTPKGVAFVKAAMEPMRYELEERWWGWRPNDLIRITDNVNSFQMGVLEVTRRTAVALAERISRTGTTDAYDENLEQSMNWLMVKASSYWFPSAESKYKEALEEMEAYLEKLKKGRATFYTRTDNLIPLLASFEDLLGSCDENLVKMLNDDGTPLSFFVVDNYFYYTQGVASAMATILEAVHHDFLLTLESRHGTELLHHAIVACQRAAELEPWIILNRDYSSVFANHRANMAAPISHARFYLGQLIKTLST